MGNPERNSESRHYTLEPGVTFSRIAIPLPSGDLGEVIRRLREEDR